MMLNNDCSVELRDFSEMSIGWQNDYVLQDLVIMAENWLVNCDLNQSNSACIPK